MKKYKIEVSKSTAAVAVFGVVGLFAMFMWPLLLSLKTKDFVSIAFIPAYLFLSWIFIRIGFLNVTISDDFFCYKILRHSKLTIPLKDISFVRLGNKHDYIDKGYPVYSKNVIVIEYFSQKKDKKVMKNFYLSLKPEDITSFMDEMKSKCNFAI